MDTENIGWHNVAELVPQEGGGLLLQRFPAAVRNDLGLSRVGRLFSSRSSNGCELRVVSDAERLRVTLSTPADDAKVLVLRGDFSVGGGLHLLEPGRLNFICLDRISFAMRTPSSMEHARFSPDLWRIYCFNAPIVFHGIEASGESFRKPTAEDQPQTRWLAYGSSITQSGQAYEGYVNTAALLLGVDVDNLGMGGSCCLEPSIAEFIAGRDDWDFCTLEIGVNMRGNFTNEEFESRARHFIQTILEAHPEKPVAVLSVFSNGNDHSAEPDNPYSRANRDFRTIAESLVAEFDSPNLQFLDGREIFADLRGFNSDLLHPGPIASVRAGEKLAGRLEGYVTD